MMMTSLRRTEASSDLRPVSVTGGRRGIFSSTRQQTPEARVELPLEVRPRHLPHMDAQAIAAKAPEERAQV